MTWWVIEPTTGQALIQAEAMKPLCLNAWISADHVFLLMTGLLRANVGIEWVTGQVRLKSTQRTTGHPPDLFLILSKITINNCTPVVIAQAVNLFLVFLLLLFIPKGLGHQQALLQWGPRHGQHLRDRGGSQSDREGDQGCLRRIRYAQKQARSFKNHACEASVLNGFCKKFQEVGNFEYSWRAKYKTLFVTSCDMAVKCQCGKTWCDCARKEWRKCKKEN